MASDVPKPQAFKCSRDIGLLLVFYEKDACGTGSFQVGHFEQAGHFELAGKG
jgi:hypothetical protein